MNNYNFKRWCIDNNHQDILDMWDYELNTEKPENINTSSNKAYYFKCNNRGKIHSVKFIIQSITHHNKLPICPYCNSFGIWCEDNNRLDLLKRWDYEKNIISPYEISISSTKKQYFKCPKGLHDSELKDLNNIRKQFGSGRCCRCDSLGQYGIDNISKNFIEKYWSDKNKISPMLINKNSQKKIWIKCNNTEYHDDYEISAINFYRGKRCPYCAGKKVSYYDSLGITHPSVIDIWSSKNKNTPYEFLPKSNKMIWWKCENNRHKDYKRTISASVVSDFNCPSCVRERKESFLQEKVRLYISSLFDNVLHEYNCTLKPINPETNRIMPYDNEVVDIKLIIEVNGMQHYSEHSFNGYFENQGMSPKESLMKRQKIDDFKKQYAIDHNYNYLEIPYWADNKKKLWKAMIDDKIKEIAE